MQLRRGCCLRIMDNALRCRAGWLSLREAGIMIALALPVAVGGDGSLRLALVGGGAEGFSIASISAMSQLASWIAPAIVAMVSIMPHRSGGRWWSW